jgi:adenine deaminase
MTDLGSPLSDAHLILFVFTSPAIPFLRISEQGLVDLKENRVVDLIIAKLQLLFIL